MKHARGSAALTVGGTLRAKGREEPPVPVGASYHADSTGHITVTPKASMKLNPSPQKRVVEAVGTAKSGPATVEGRGVAFRPYDPPGDGVDRLLRLLFTRGFYARTLHRVIADMQWECRGANEDAAPAAVFLVIQAKTYVYLLVTLASTRLGRGVLGLLAAWGVLGRLLD